MSFRIGQRVRILPLPSIARPFHNLEARVVSASITCPCGAAECDLACRQIELIDELPVKLPFPPDTRLEIVCAETALEPIDKQPDPAKNWERLQNVIQFRPRTSVTA